MGSLARENAHRGAVRGLPLQRLPPRNDDVASTRQQLVGETVEFIRLVHMLDRADEEAGCPVDGVPKEAELRAKLPLERAVPTQDKLENDVEDEDDFFYRCFSIFFEMLCTTGRA